MSQGEVKTENVAEPQPDPVVEEAPKVRESKKEPEVVAEAQATEARVEGTPEPKGVLKDEESKAGETKSEKHVSVVITENVAGDEERDADDKLDEDQGAVEEGSPEANVENVPQRSIIDEDRLLSTDITDIIGEDNSDDEGAEYLKRGRLSTQIDFFQKLGAVPSLSDISLSADVEEYVEEIPKIPSVVELDPTKDVGKFVHPLTGEVFEGEEEEQEEEEEITGSDEGSDTSSEDLDFDLSSIISVKEEKPKEDAVEEDDLQAMFELMQEPPPQVEEVDTLMIEREMERIRQLQIRESTIKFLNRLIDRAMDTADFVDPKQVLRNSLDKTKLLDQLYEDLIELEKERRSHFFLNSKMVEYYRRSKNFGPISPDPPSLLQKRYINYMEALEQLDFLLGKESQTIQNNEDVMLKETSRLAEMEELVMEAEQHLEKTILTTMIKSKSTPRWKMVVEKALLRMATARSEISNERLRIVIQQHTLAELTERLNKIEHISPNFTMTMYERTMGKVIKLGDNLHDLNQNISKVNDEYHNVSHLVAHIREKRQMMVLQIATANATLTEVKNDHNQMRDRLYTDKLKHVQLLTELQDLSFNVGLMDKPLLMHDYDKTIEDIEEITKELVHLRKKLVKPGQKNKFKNQKHV